jgi:hypothetical protein
MTERSLPIVPSNPWLRVRFLGRQLVMVRRRGDVALMTEIGAEQLRAELLSGHEIDLLASETTYAYLDRGKVWRLGIVIGTGADIEPLGEWTKPLA